MTLAAEAILMLRSDEFWEVAMSRIVAKGVHPNDIVSFYDKGYRDKIVTELISGTYKFSIPKLVGIPKPDGGVREIFVQPPTDRLIMTAIYMLYYMRWESQFDAGCLSYQIDTSVSQISKFVQKNLKKSAVKIDISKFFDSVPAPLVQDMIKKLEILPGLTEILCRFYTETAIYKKGELVHKPRSLCQGCAFSPILANLILKGIDAKYRESCDFYVRYCDDILIVAPDLDSKVASLRKDLEHLGLSVNNKKVHYYDNTVEFLGCSISKECVGFSKDRKQRIKREIKAIAKKYGRVGDRHSQLRVMHNIQKHLLQYVDGHNAFEGYCQINTDDSDIVWINDICKRTIRSTFTGKNNYTTNMHKTPDSWLFANGWCDLDYLYRIFQTNKKVFRCLCWYYSQPTVTKHISEISHEKALDTVMATQEFVPMFRQGLLKVGSHYYRITDKRGFCVQDLDLHLIDQLAFDTPFTTGISVDMYHQKDEALRTYAELCLRILESETSSSELYIEEQGFCIPTILFKSL